MRSRWILNLVLAAIVGSLALYVLYRPQLERNDSNALTDLKPSAVTQIQVEHTGKKATVLTREARGWHMSAPLPTRANSFTIDNLLRVLSAGSDFRTPAVTSELAQYGLERPTLRLRFNSEEIAIGAMHPLKRAHYALYRDTVHLIPTAAIAPAFLEFTSFIDSQLLEPDREPVELHLARLQLRRIDGTWRRESADKKGDGEISGDRVNAFVAHWQNARALTVSRLTARKPLDSVQIVFERDGRRDTLVVDVLSYRPELILARRDEGLEYHFPEEIGKQLLQLPVDD